MTTKDKIKELSRELNIDPYALHTMCAGQPVLFEEAGMLASKSRSRARQAKLELERMKAEISLSIREDPGKHGLDKITEASVSALVLQHKDVKAAQKAWINVERVYEQCSVLQSAFEHRRSMLNNEVTLFNLEYWSVEDPSTIPRKHKQGRLAKGRSRKKGDGT